jgi:hypothetical protein
LLVGLSVAAQAQAPAQFSAEIVVRDLDGGTGTGKLYIGPTKQRMEFTAFGEVRPTIVDPANDTQQTISPRQRNFMELPRGESGGPVRIPRLNPVDPNNPCSSGELSECRRLVAETVNGMPTQKWEYTNTDGERVTAWIATRLRFPVKTTADTGATNEIRNVVEGPQPATLFAVPTGFAQVDDIGGSGNAIADALASVNPALMQQALNQAKQMDATNKANPQLPAKAAIWETGAGFVMTFTITMNATKDFEGGIFPTRSHSTLSMRYTASVPLNYGTPAVPPTVGPRWGVLQLAGSGSRQAEALPATMALEWQEHIDTHVDTGRCEGIEQVRTDTSTDVRGKAAGRGLITQSATQGYAQAFIQINGLLTAYDFAGGFGTPSPADVVTTSRTVDHCARDRVTNATENTKPEVAVLGQLSVDIKNVPLPPTPAGLQGTRTLPWQFNGYQGPATVEWNIVPIAAR